jgi:cytochrome oxidase assembly protein ShyY1
MSDPTPDKRLRWTFDWKVGVLTLLLVPLTLSLGFWQLERAEEKRLLLLQHEQQQMAPPVAVETLAVEQVVANQPVVLIGHFDNSKTWLLDNRMHQGKPGYDVVSPFVIETSGLVVLLNRGWVPGDIRRQSLPTIDVINGQQLIQATVYQSPGKPVTLAAEVTQTAWPKVIQQLDWDYVKQDVTEPLFPHLLRIEPFSPGAYVAEWVVVNIQPQKHTAYAVQWFTMAGVLLLLFITRSSNMMAFLKRKRQQ